MFRIVKIRANAKYSPYALRSVYYGSFYTFIRHFPENKKDIRHFSENVLANYSAISTVTSWFINR